MPADQDVHRVVRAAFADIAYLIGAVGSAHRLDDRAMWSLLRRLDRLRTRTLHRLGAGPAAPPGAPEPLHPAVAAFLARGHATEGGLR